MPQYKIGESIFNIEDSKVEEFLNIAKQNNDIPELIEDTPIVDPGKKKTPKKKDANEESATTASSTESASADGSLDSEKKIERPFASIGNVPYTLSQFEAAAKKAKISLGDYLRSFELKGEQDGIAAIEYYPEVIQLEEVIVEAEDKKKSKERKIAAEMSFIDKLGVDIAKGSVNLGEMMASVPETIYDIFSLPQNLLAKITGLEKLETSSEKFKKTLGVENPILEYYSNEKESLEKIQNIYNNANYDAQGIYENFKLGNYSDAFKQLASGITESAPVSLSMMIGGATMSMGRLSAVGTVAFGGPEIKGERVENPAQSEFANIAKGLGLAAAETVFSSIGTGTLGKVYKDIILKEGQEQGAKIFKQGLVDMYATAIKKFGAPAAMLGEGLEEVATTITQNMIKGRNPFENVADSFIQGVGGGAVYGAPINTIQAISAVNEGIASLKVNKELEKSKFNNLIEAFKPGNEVTQDIVNISKIKNADKLFNKKIDLEVSNGNISIEEAEEVKLNFRKTQLAINTLAPLNFEPKLEVEAADLLIKKEGLINQINKINDDSLTFVQKNELNKINERLKAISIEDLNAKTKEKGEQDIAKGKDIAEALPALNLTIKDFNTTTELKEALSKEGKSEEEVQKLSNEFGFIIQKKDGTQDIYINKKVAFDSGVATTAQHEVLHAILRKAIVGNVELGRSLKDFVKEISGQKFSNTEFAKRFEGYENDYANTLSDLDKKLSDGLITQEKYNKDSQQALENLYEETMPLLSEAITSNDISANSSIWEKLKDFFNRLFNTSNINNIKFDSGKDVFNFVKDYNKIYKSGRGIKTLSKIAEGKIEGRLVSEIKERSSEAIKLSSAAQKKKIDELEEKLLSGEIDYDEYDTKLAAIEEEIAKSKDVEVKEKKPKAKSTEASDAQKLLNEKVNKLVGPKNEAGKYIITQEQWLGGGIKKAYDAIILGSLIDPLITRGIQGDNVYGKPIDQFIEDVKNGIADLLVRFNPEKNDSLIGFINTQLSFRKGDVLNKYKKQAGTSSIDIEAGEVGSIQELMSEEDAEFEILKSEELALEKEEKARPTLLKTVKLSDEVKGKLDDSTIKAIAVNIKKFDQEISKNRTITPFVAELKKDISNAMEQTMISYIRTYGYEKFLKENRETYLQTMPTSFLSKHPVFRKGILKRVNGKWMSPIKIGKEKYDWVDANGKKLKIDRDNAAEGRGLTSGPEFIKRNPDIVNVVSENEFIDYHFMDGAKRRVSKQNPLSSMARQIPSEVAFEIIQQDLRSGGKLTEEISKRAELTGLVITDEIISEIDKDIDRGLIKLSKAIYNNAVILESVDVIDGKENLINPLQDYFTTIYTNIKKYYNNNKRINALFDETFKNVFNINKESDKKLIANFKSNALRKAKVGLKDIADAKLKPTIDEYLVKAKGYGDAFSSLVENESVKAILGIEDLGISSDRYRKHVNEVFNQTYILNSLGGDKVIALANAWKLLSPTITKKDTKGNYYENVEDFYNGFLKDFAEKIGVNLTLKDSKEIIYNGKNLKNLSSINTGITFIPQKATSKGIKTENVIIGALEESIESDEVTINVDDVVNNLQERNAQADVYAEQFINTITYFANRIKESKTTAEKNNSFWQLYALIEMSKNDMRGMLKIAFPLKYLILDLNTFKPDETKFTYEHTVPAKELAKDIAALVKEFVDNNTLLQDEFKAKLVDLFNNQTVSLTQKSIDNALTKAGLRSALNKLESDKRYLSEIIKNTFFKGAIVDLETGKVYSFEDADNAGIKLSKANKSYSLNDPQATSSYFNDMIERKKGIGSSESISKVTAKLEGRSKGRFSIFVPPSAEDFEGLLYQFMGAGESGEIDRAFFEEKLLLPLAEGNYQLNYERQLLKKKYALLLKSNKGILKRLREESNYKFYTIDSAVRVYIWDKLRFDIPGLYDKDIIELVKIVEADPALKKFADQMARFPRKQESWQMPKENWAASTLEYDLQQTLDKVGRKRIFAKFIENRKIIFSEENLNKVEAAYGSNFRSALEDMLYRIENGKARESGKDRIANAYMNWVRGSVAVTMFLNTRSALLQQLSMVNFSNWEENNPLAQAKAFANTKQWASDWAMLWNSDWMKERREGLKTDINESELITAMESSRDKTKALLHWVLTQGFSLTKYGDNFAIATGGAAYYRNRVNKYLNEGLETAEAEKKAFLDFQEIAERTQQSSRQDLLSNQQVSVAGRLFLAFQNTPMQMTRLTKKAVLDLVNNRGSRKANISKILYYSAIQNMIFAFFQNALFAITGLDDEDEEDEKLIDSKTERAINNILDGVLRGSGIAGGTIATIKNVLIQVKKQEEAGWKGDGAYILLEAANVAPPVGIKARRFYGAYKNYKINKNIIDKVPYSNLNHPLYGIAGSLSGAAFNVPLDRLLSKANNVVEASNSDHEAWQRIALFLGYTPYDLGIQDDELARIRKQVKEDKKKSNKKIGEGKSFRVSPVRVKPKRVN